MSDIRELTEAMLRFSEERDRTRFPDATRTFLGGEDLLRSRGVEAVMLDDAACIELMEELIAREPGLWNEDIGEE